MNAPEKPSRRRGNRYPLRLKAQLAHPRNRRDRSPAPKAEAWTQNISGRGIYLEMDETLAPGGTLVVTLDLPTEPGEERVSIWLFCRIVRAVQDDSHRGVGAIIERYEFKRGDQPGVVLATHAAGAS